jgi:uncharacterized Zn-binding protein involved in type VI secretion
MSGVYGTYLGTPGARAGLATLEIDGEVYDLVGEGTYDATNLVREPLVGQSGVQGFSEMPKYGQIGGTCRDSGSLTVSAIKQKTNSSVKLVMINGKTAVGDGMFCTECSKVNTVEGTFSVMFMGNVTENPVTSS